MIDNIENKFSVRRANIEDMVSVRTMIQELADFENMSSGPKLTTDDLIKDAGWNGQQEFFHCYIAEARISPPERPLTCEPIGYAVCFFSYSTWEGKCYFLEDLYIKPSYRKQGAGKLLFKSVAQAAQTFNCCRLDFHVLDWNPARKFYEKLGAISLTEKEGWQFYRLSKEKIDQILTKVTI